MIFIYSFDSRIAGIPCIIGITHYHHQPRFIGSPILCDSDMDYYGYTEVEWSVLDSRGRHAPWLERKLTDDQCKAINSQAIKHMSNNNE